MCPTTSLVFFVLIIIFVITAAISVAHFLSTSSFESKFILRYGGSKTWLGNSWTTQIEGYQVDFVYAARSKNTPSRLVVSLKGDFFAHALFRPETGTDRFAKDIGINQEIQIFDLPFDQAVYVECEDREFISRLLAGDEVKRNIQAILADMVSIEIKGDRCIMQKTPCDDLTLVDQEELMAIARRMVAVAQRIPLPGPGERSSTPVTEECRRWINFFIGFSVVMAGAGVILVIWGGSVYRLLWPWQLFCASLYVSLPLAAVTVIYMFYQFKGLSVALRSFITAGVTAAVAAVLLVWGGGMVLNGSQDVSPLVRHEVRVIDKDIKHGNRGGNTYYIILDSWDPRLPYYKFSVRRPEYENIQQGSVCTVTTGAGLFGFEWVARPAC